MSWATKYRCEVDDVYGVSWKIEIEEDAFAGTVTTLVGAGDPVLFEWNNDSDDVFDPIKTSRLNLTVWSETNFSLIDLYSTEDLQFRVKAYQNTVLFWTGYIITGNYTEPYIDVPYPVTITASCGLEHLKNTLYKYETASPDDTYYNGRRYESQIIIDILGKLGYTGFTEYVNLYEEGMEITTAHSPFDQIKIDVDIFKDMYCYEVLQEVLKKYNACIIHKDGGFVLYRPTELVGATVYGRIFTAVTTKSATSFTSVKYINRSGHASTLRQVPGGALMVQRPAKTINVYQDYGNKESWIENWEFKPDSYDSTGFTYDNWTRDGAGVNIFSFYFPGESDGIILPTSTTTYGNAFLHSSFGDNALACSDAMVLEFDYILLNLTTSALGYIQIIITIEDDGSNYYLDSTGDGYAEWSASSASVTYAIDNVPVGYGAWEHTKINIPNSEGLPVNGPYTITLCVGKTTATGAFIGLRKLQFYSTSDEITVRRYKESYFPFIWSKWKTTRTYTDVEEIVQNTYTKTNAINGVDLDYNYLLGDVTDANIDNIIEQFAGSLAVEERTYIKRVDTVTLTGTSGSVNILCDGVTKAAILISDLATAASTFASTWDASYTNLDVTSSGVDIIFTAKVAGVDFTGSTTVTNTGGDLGGTVTPTTANGYTTELVYGTDWNTRGGSESKPLLEIIGDEIAEQYSRPKQLIQMSILETGTAVTALNLIGHYEDDLNDVTSGGANRKFVINRGEFSVKNRKYDIDFCEII